MKVNISLQVEEEVHLSHFWYSTWPEGDSSAVPAATHGLLDLVEHATAHKVSSFFLFWLMCM